MHVFDLRRDAVSSLRQPTRSAQAGAPTCPPPPCASARVRTHCHSRGSCRVGADAEARSSSAAVAPTCGLVSMDCVELTNEGRSILLPACLRGPGATCRLGLTVAVAMGSLTAQGANVWLPGAANAPVLALTTLPNGDVVAGGGFLFAGGGTSRRPAGVDQDAGEERADRLPLAALRHRRGVGRGRVGPAGVRLLRPSHARGSATPPPIPTGPCRSPAIASWSSLQNP